MKSQHSYCRRNSYNHWRKIQATQKKKRRNLVSHFKKKITKYLICMLKNSQIHYPLPWMIISQPSEWLKWKKKTLKLRRLWSHWNTHTLLMEEKNLLKPLLKTGSFFKIILKDSEIPLSRYILKEMRTYIYHNICIHMFIKSIFIKAIKWKISNIHH